MTIWKVTPTLEVLTERAQGTLIAHLWIEFLDIEGSLCAPECLSMSEPFSPQFEICGGIGGFAKQNCILNA